MNKRNEAAELGFIKTSTVLFLITLIVKILGLFREILMATYIGMNQATDAYNMALLATSLITGVSGIAIGSSIIPVLASISSNKKGEDQELFFLNVFWTMMVIAFVVAGLLYIFAAPVIKMLAPGFDDNTVNLTANLFQIGFIKINAIVAASLFTQYLNYKKCFYPPMIASSIGTVLLVGYFLVVGNSANVSTFMLMTVLTYIVQVLWMLPAMIKSGIRFRLYWNPRDSYIILFFSLALPAILNYFAQQIGIVVNRALASQLGTGSISALSYANSIVMMINMTISLSIATVIFPRLAEALSRDHIDKAITIFRQGIFLAFIFLIPATVGLIILAESISSVIFERGVFTAENSAMTALALCGYSIGVIAYALCEISNRFFNSMKNTKTPMITAFVGATIMIISSFLLYKPLQVFGVALAATTIQVVMSVLLLCIISKEHGEIFDKDTGLNIIRIITATFIMALVLGSIRHIEFVSTMGGVINLIIKIVVAIIIYVISLIILFVGKQNEIITKMLR